MSLVLGKSSKLHFYQFVFVLMYHLSYCNLSMGPRVWVSSYGVGVLGRAIGDENPSMLH